MNDTRACDYETLVYLCRQAEKHDFNRQLVTELVESEADRDGIVVLQAVLWHHHSTIPRGDRKPWPDHHRCRVIFRAKSQEAPVEAMLDVEARLWETLITPAELLEKASSPLHYSIPRGEDDDE